MINTTYDRDEVDALITVLQSKGIAYLTGDGTPLSEEDQNVDPVRLIQRLAACGFPLVEHASISLFILHPELAPSVVAAIQSSPTEIAEKIAVLVLATLYLQRWWYFRLAFALGRLPCFPEEPFVSLWEERHLPPPRDGFGQEGFLTLEEYEQQRYGIPLNFLGDWQNQIDHLLNQEEAHQRQLPDDVVNYLRQLSQSLRDDL
jgi:hypothetical protein